MPIAWMGAMVACLTGMSALAGPAGAVAAAHSFTDSVTNLVPESLLSFYARATNAFNAADFLKPAEKPDGGLDFKLAPLLMREVLSNRPDGSAVANPIASLRLTNGVLVLDTNSPTVYVWGDTTRIGGQESARFTYLWCYAMEPVTTAAPRPAVQGIRLTLDSGGQPAFWEVLADPSGVELIFVAQHVEAAALAEFGKPLPGRRYAVEQALEATPNIVVARVLEDGPVPMGPFVYLDAAVPGVVTLLCRCMPAQVKELRRTLTYELVPYSASPSDWLWSQARSITGAKTAFWPGEQATSERLARCLRLPSARPR